MTSPISQLRSLYVTHSDYKEQLKSELKKECIGIYGDYFLCQEYVPSVWALDVWKDVQVLKINSIADAQRQLSMIQKVWTASPQILHRRTELIAAKLKKPKNPKIDYFLNPDFTKIPTGYFCLWDEHHVLYSRSGESPFVGGIPQIREDRSGPPARAYLKLVECLMRIGKYPRPGSLCLDLGAAPGSWTYVLLKLGARVIAYDRADLSEKVKKMGSVELRLQDAFRAEPECFDQVDWLFSDVICYPPKLYDFIQKWIASGRCQNFVCTIKLQGQEHYEWIPKFCNLPNANVFHSYFNKHELTLVISK